MILSTYATPRTATERYEAVLVSFSHILDGKIVRIEDLWVRIQMRTVLCDHRRNCDVRAFWQNVVR